MRRLRMVATAVIALAMVTGCGEEMVADGDGGRVDAGGDRDSGPPVDSGPPSDSGPPVDSGMLVDGGMTSGCDDPIPNLSGERITTEALNEPIFVAQPAGSTDLYVVERRGRIRIVRDGSIVAAPFLDITSQTGSYTDMGGDERGLLGMAFHPEYATNGRFFLYLAPTDGRQENLVVEGARSAGSADVANPTVTDVIRLTGDTLRNHNGGHLAFGPDGYLYIGTGDGGGGGDPADNGQDLGSLYGKMLRIDVDGAAPYAIPSSNPFIGMAGAEEEIWAYGLRNPFRWSFDRTTGDLYIGDVGQNAWEEIDFQSEASMGGENYGWNMYEATHMFGGGGPLRGPSMHTPPVYEYRHEQDDAIPAAGISVVGGYVYRGSAIPALRGVYVFGDLNGSTAGFRYCEGAVHGTRTFPGLNSIPGSYIYSFAEDQSGELYVMFATGQVYHIVAAP
ncbi:MAG: PQQ-dependent sugar dehydrogenase [Myxococcota bacterium]|nr:PQQ-dependent sugar dehydrogenase [Myxococcota bacterium]